MNDSPVYVSLEFTPNPNTLKYSVNRTLISRGAASFSNEQEAEKKSPLAAKLLGVEGIESVMLGRDFVTVTKSETGSWDHVHKTASQLLEDHLARGEVILHSSEESNTQGHGGGDSELEAKIKAFLDQEIRPAVAMDGGDITFDRFEDGIVYLFLQGSCSGCPSSTMTLKMGIETRMKQVIPQVREVVSV
jgi:Fe-S cluster biogenesis protein NfuA